MIKNPFKFLESFGKEDKERFFGRNKETTQLYNAVHASNLILVYGSSGTGKTSLINCGLANQFQDSDWYPLFVRREDDINESLQKILKGEFPDGTGTDISSLISQIYFQVYRPVYLLFDQFEELYISGTKAEQEKFHETVFELISKKSPCKVILIIREEYIAYLSEFEKVVPSLFDNRLRIEKMNDRNLMKVILGTARYGDIEVVDKVKTCGMILENLRDKRFGIDLTQLQVYLDRLYREDILRQGVKTPEKITFDPSLIERVGAIKDVISDFIDEQLKIVEKGLSERGVAKPDGLPLEVLFTMVTEDGTKRNMVLEAITKDLPRNRSLSSEDVEFCLEEFYRIKLLRKWESDN